MVEFTKPQARVAKALVSGPKTEEELRKELGMPLNKVTGCLAELIKLNMVSKSGFPTKYSLIEEVRRGAMEEEKTTRPFKAHIIVEGMSKSKEHLEKAQKELLGKIKQDKLLRVQNIDEKETEKDGDVFTTFFEADVSCKTFEDLVYMALNYGPSSIELYEPREFTLKSDEAQGALMDMASVIHSYAHIIADLRIKLEKESINIV